MIILIQMYRWLVIIICICIGIIIVIIVAVCIIGGLIAGYDNNTVG